TSRCPHSSAECGRSEFVSRIDLTASARAFARAPVLHARSRARTRWMGRGGDETPGAGLRDGTLLFVPCTSLPGRPKHACYKWCVRPREPLDARPRRGSP